MDNITTAQNLGNPVRYSRGKSKYDNKPTQREAENFDAFVEAVWADKSAKKGLTYICAPMIEGLHSEGDRFPGVNTWRQKKLAGRRAWQPFDVDFLAGQEALAELLVILGQYRGVVYTTANSTDAEPRVRVILEADREMKYDESVNVGFALQAQVVEQMGDRIKFDKSVYNGEQPCYLPTTGSQRYDLQGAPLCVDSLVTEAEVQPTKEKPAQASLDTDRGSYEDWIVDLLSGNDVHGGATRVVGRMVAEGCSDTTIWTFFRMAAESIANNRDDKRVYELLDQGELKRLIAGARAKGFAPDQEPTEFVLKPVAAFVAEGFSDAWFIDEVIPKAGLGLIYGASGSGKSFFAIDMMVAIAQGEKWRGRDTEKAKIVYIAAEGVVGVKKRFLAQQIERNVDLPTLGIQVVDVAPNFLRDDDVALAEAICKAGGADIVVVDTLAQTTPGANENSSEDMGAALGRCKRLHEATGAMVILVHHSGKDASKGARGWSGIKGALDVEIEVSQGPMARTAKVTKLKDGEDMAAFYFDLKPVVLGERDNGKKITSCVVVEAMFSADTTFKPKSKKQKAVWDYVSSRVDDGDYRIPVDDIVEHINQTTVRRSEGKDRRAEYTRDAVNIIAAAGGFTVENDVVNMSKYALETGSEEDDIWD